LIGKPNGNRPIGIPRSRRKDNIKMHIRKIELGGIEWIHLAQDRGQWRALMNTIMNF
jgi:hypothetical protein